MNVPLIHPPRLLERAALLLPGSDPLDWQQAGFLCRSALETQCRLEVQRRGVPRTAGAWHVRLFHAGLIDYSELKLIRELLDLGSSAVHNNYFVQRHAEELFDGVTAFTEGRNVHNCGQTP